MPTNRKLLLTVSLGILVAIIGPVLLVQSSESIKIRWNIYKLGNEDATTRKKAFGWLKRLAKDNLEDKRLKAFFKHPESLKQVEIEAEAKLEIPLISAVNDGNLVYLRILLDQGADVNAIDLRGFTPLHYAAWHEHGHGYRYEKIVMTLIKHGANVNAKGQKGRTPLDSSIFSLEAAHKKKISITDILIREHGGKTGAELKEEAKKK